MSPMVWLGIVWGVLTGILVILLIYRGTLTMQEDSQLFLDDAESHMEKEQAELLSKVNKINPLVKLLRGDGVGTGRHVRLSEPQRSAVARG